jgi:TolB protein
MVSAAAQTATDQSSLILPEEKHLRNIRQLTFGGENAEAYFSADNKWLSMQRTTTAGGCDQIYLMKVPADRKKEKAEEPKLVSTGKGKTTCAYIFPSGKKILYSSTHLGDEKCPPRPDYSRGYVWPIHSTFDIFIANRDGSQLKQLTTEAGYDAEATIRRDGKSIVFTSMRDGDLDIYAMDANGKNVRRLTNELGYDGGPFFSADGKKIVYRAHHPKDPKDIADYQALLKEGLLRPTKLEIMVMNADGSGKRQVTKNGKANFAPFWHPDGKRIVFASNMDDPRGRNFDIYIINEDGTGQQRITYSADFDGFPMFTSDGKKLVFSSNRNSAKQGDTNVFLADWVD